jgi:ABC-type proline/glycine betaine transport system permease subunit
LALYGAITAILIAVVADRLLQYMEIAERAAMEATINQ